jgi:heme-degrading monooxygenase HmoA
MFVHLAIWRTKPETPRSWAEQAKRKLESLNGQIPGLIRIEVGLNTLDSENAGDLSMISEFESPEAYAVYQSHPLHEAVKPHFAGVIAERRFVDYET